MRLTVGLPGPGATPQLTSITEYGLEKNGSDRLGSP